MRLNVARWGDEGPSRTAVLLHGVTSNAGSWVRVGPALAAAGFSVYAPDLRGHGESPKPSSGYSFTDMVSDLPENVPVSPDLLIGHSLGGTLAIVAMASGVLTPSSLLLEDPALHMPHDGLPSRLLREDERAVPLDPDVLLLEHPTWERVDAEAKAASVAAVDWDHMRQAFVGNVPWDLRPAVRALAGRLPVRVILADASVFVSVDDATTFEAALGPGSVVTVAGAGHSIHRDDLEAYMAIVLDLVGSR